VKGRLRVEMSLGTVRLAGWLDGCAVAHLPSQGEPPSSMAAMLQGFVVVSGVGRAMLPLCYVWLQLTTALGLVG
jgi:hypothetical protein